MDSVLSSLLQVCVFGALCCLGVVGLQIRVMGTDAFGRVGKMILFAGLVFLLLAGTIFGIRRLTGHDKREPSPADTELTGSSRVHRAQIVVIAVEGRRITKV